MKKYELSKILGITFIIGVLLTWLIPTGQFSEEGFKIAATNPLGFIDLFRTPLNTFANFIHYAMAFLAIGGLYGVMGKTGVYSIIVDKIVKKFKTKKENFLILTSIIFILLSSVLGVNLLIFTIVPFFATVLLLLGYNKLTSLVVTVGAMLTGGLGATYSNSINTSLRYFLNVSINNEIVTRLIFLVIISFVFIMFVLSSTKKEKDDEVKKEEVKIPLYTKNVKKDRNAWPLIIVCGFAFILLTLGMFDWAFSFDIDFFKNMHESIMGLETNGYPFVANIIGAINAFGNWSMYDLTILLMILTVVIAWIYSLKVKDVIDAFVDGAKEMLPVAFYVTMANILFSLIYFGQSGVDIFNTISNFLLGITEKFNMITMSLTSIIGSFFYNDFIQYSNVLGTVVGSIYNNTIIYPKIALILQFMYGLTMFVAPTSILLIAGLSYFGISYKEWLKHIWKYLVKVFVIVLVVLIIVMMFV